mgnify:CR=1 FL=1
MQYALFYIDFFVNNIQKNHHLTALNGDFIIVCVTFLIIPFNRFSPFLPKKVGIKQNGYYCVNALYRAFSISTLPSGNALKWSICRLDFAGNCLTTSKSAYFLLFLCLFTLCSYFVTVQHKKIIDNTMSLFIVLSIIFLW